MVDLDFGNQRYMAQQPDDISVEDTINFSALSELIHSCDIRCGVLDVGMSKHR